MNKIMWGYLVLFASSVEAGFITLNLWQKGDKKIAVMGDQRCDIELRELQKLWPDDKKQWNVFRTALGKINSKKDQKNNAFNRCF